MMLSLPVVAPQDEYPSWLQTTASRRAPSPNPAAGAGPQGQAPNAQQAHRQRQQRDEERRLFNARSPLALLAADEAAIAQRKAAVRNFGAYWIRPPGVPKTLQAMTEEEAERLEQAELERQERGLLDMQAQQQLEEARMRAEQTAEQQEEGGAEGEDEEDLERDLDDEIPDADESADAEDSTTADVTFNEDSMMEDSHIARAELQHDADGIIDADEDEEGDHYAELEEAELTGAAQDEEDLGLERDLDDSVPEAGSYQHTDTEVEDSDSDSGLQDSSLLQEQQQQQQHPRSLGRTPQLDSPGRNSLQGLAFEERMRAQVGAANAAMLPRSPGSLNLSSSLLDTSQLVTSSPVLQRPNAGERARAHLGRRGERQG